MTKASEKFERQIERIHDLLEQSGSTITWNDHLPDPDNPEQLRQIDISIRHDNKLTIVECRIHRKKQDVKWIEELIGRRVSLQADAVIAVSASGFTEGAITKAKAFGVILRDILSLTEEEILQWGHKTKVTLIFYEYTDVGLVFTFDPKYIGKITIDDVIKYLETNPNEMYGIFEFAAKVIEKKLRLQPSRFRIYLSNEKLKVDDKQVKTVQFSARFRQVNRKLCIPTVMVYGVPNADALKRNVFIEAVELGDFEITKSEDDVSLVIDLSAIKSPPNCQFRIILFDFTKTVTICNTTFLGKPEMKVTLKDINIGINFN